MDLHSGLPFWIVKNEFFDLYNPLRENYKIDVYISIKSKLKKCEKETLEIDFKEDFLVKPRNIYPFYKIDSNTFATILQKIENCEGNEIVEKI